MLHDCICDKQRLAFPMVAFGWSLIEHLIGRKFDDGDFGLDVGLGRENLFPTFGLLLAAFITFAALYAASFLA
jgi:hypothetical protein